VRQIIAELSRKRHLGQRERQQVADEVYTQLRSKPWPEWFMNRFKARYGEHAAELEAALRQRADSSLRGVITPKQSMNPGLLRDARSDDDIGWIDPGSVYIAQQVKAYPGERVLDLCAGGGGKTKILAQTGASITAVDINSKRLDAVRKIPGVRVIPCDGRSFRNEPFDWILVDAPCSGTGTLRHAPDLFGRLQESDITKYVGLQKELVANAVKLLKPTGKLVYATCSLLAEENHSTFEGLQLLESKQLLPTTDGTDGFWVAVFKPSSLRGGTLPTKQSTDLK
jgi:16S rRNA C967 or C1407 C5-methylase (RsmB/RsmF family)